jgi:hypothetical protein
VAEFSFATEATSSAPPDVVYAVLADATRWKDWAGWFIRESSWEREGTPSPGGVGAVKRLGAKPIYSREETVDYDPPRHYAYRILSGPPVNSYRADVDLSPVATGGTHIRWRFTFESKVPGTGALMRFYLGRIVGGLARRLAAHAEKRTA